MVAGAIAGSLGVAAVYPLELCRVRLQVQVAHRDWSGMWDCLAKTIRGEGLRGLYKGASSPILGATLTKTVNFGVFGAVLQRLTPDQGSPPSPLHITTAGIVGALAASFILTPVDRAKILLQVQRSARERALAEGRPLSAVPLPGELPTTNYSGPLDVWRQQGLRGMWRGQAATALREFVYGALYFSVFEKLKGWSSLLLGLPLGQSSPLPVLMVCGAATGAINWTVMFPFDVIKSKTQAAQGVAPPMYRLAAQHFAAEGFAGFYKGWATAIARSLPAHAVILSTYTVLMDMMTK